MAYVSLGHAIRNILLREEKEQNINPAKKKGPPGGDWEEASEEDRKGKSKEIVKSVNTPGQKEVKEALRSQPTKEPAPPVSGAKDPTDNFTGTPGAFLSGYSSKSGGHGAAIARIIARGKSPPDAKMENAPSDMGDVSAQLNTEDGGKKKVKEMSELGGQTSSQSNPEPEDGGKKKKIKEEFGAAGLTSLKGEDGGKKKVKKESAFDTAGGDTPMGSMGGKSNPGPSARMNTEDGGKKKKIKEEAEGTKERKTIENVARPKSAISPFDRKSKLAKNAEIKTKIIDEGKKRADTIRKVVKGDKGSVASENSGNGSTKVIGGVVWNPNLQKPDKDTVSN
jgi:hypothetical protein